MMPSVQSASSASLPPLPDLQSASGTGGTAANAGQAGDAMSAIISGLAPIKQSVDAIMAACKQIVTSGAVPGAEQPCAQIVALATSLLPMAAQQALQPTAAAPSPMQSITPASPPPPTAAPPQSSSPFAGQGA